jgi:hypothetical protein
MGEAYPISTLRRSIMKTAEMVVIVSIVVLGLGALNNMTSSQVAAFKAM